MFRWIDYLGNKVSYDLARPLEKDKTYMVTIKKSDNMPVSVFLDDRILIGETTDNTLTFISPSSGYSTISFAAQKELDIEWVYLQRGKIKTDWAPSYKDARSQILQLSDMINLRVAKGELLSQINVEAGGVLITSGTNKLNITPLTTYIQDATIKSAMIDTINVNKITGITADFTSLVTKGLTANVITSTMIKADDAMFTKLFATSMATDKLVAQGAWITDANIVSLDAGTIKSGTIATARLDAVSVVTNGLTANVVESKHIKSEIALVDKIFSDEAYIKRLTSKAAFIGSIQAIDISASKITSGELDASKIKVSNLDANSITANQANLVKAGFISSSGGSLNLSGDRLLSTASDGSQTYIGAGRVNFRNPDGATLGGIGYEDYGASPYLTLRTSWGSHFRITARQEVSAGDVIDRHVLTVTAGKEMYLNTDNTYVTGDMTMQKAVKVGGHLSLSGGEVNQLNRVRFAKGAYLEEQPDGDVQLKSAGTQLQFYQASGRIMYSEGTRLFLDLPINMQGNGILNQSDERLKTDFNYDELDSLSALMEWKHAGYRYINQEFNQERQFSVIAQSALDLVVPDENGYLQVNLSKQVNMTSHALQQHVIKTNDKLEQLEAKMATLEKELATLKGA